MSRCSCCSYPFEEEDAWQEYCSVSCAMCHIVGRVVTADDQANDTNTWRKWIEWFSVPRNKLRVRINGEPAQKPRFGKWVKRQVNVKLHGHDKEIKIIDCNIGGAVVHRPMTKQECEEAKRQRGRESFGANMVDNQVWRDLPSKRGLVGSGWFPHDE